MSDHPTTGPDDERTTPPDPDVIDMTVDAAQDPAHARIRALLAEQGSAAGGAPESMPPEVVSRLEDTLALLAAERAQGVVPLAPRRSRRWAPRGLVAAAAVVVIGLGGAAVGGLGGFPGIGGRDEGAVGGASSADTESAPQDGAGAATAPDAGLGASGMGVPSLTSTTFARDARALVASGVLGPLDREGPSPRLSGGDDAATPSPRDGSSGGSPSGSPGATPSAPPDASGSTPGSSESVPRAAECAGPDLGREADQAAVTPVLLDGSPAALVVRPTGDRARADASTRGRLLVEAWSCDGETRLAAAKVTP